VTEAELDAIRSGDRAAFGDRERAVLDAVEVIGVDPARSETAIDALRAWFDARAIAELVFLVGFYWMVTRATLALQIEHDTVSWGETDAALDG
jgi:alkylhydroperoxidase family enzyme